MPQMITTVSQEPCARVTAAILAHMAVTDVSGPPGGERAISQLEESAAQMRGCAILDSSGRVLAATGDAEEWRDASRELLAAADAAADEPVDHAHIATADGEAFCVREGGLTGFAVTERFVLASLTIFDLRNALRQLAAAGVGGP